MPIISIENLSKSYLVGHQASNRERYTSLRDVAAQRFRSFARNGCDMLMGRQMVQGDEIEEFWALKDVSFDIKQGDVVGIIGRNGAGKSTLLKILSRITEPTSGRVTLRGRVASLLEVGTGFHPELTGRENIFLNGAILGMSRSEIKRKFDEIVAFAEVEKFLDTPVKRYSSGMYVRLAFSVAAHLEPEILVIDEVLAVGDAKFQAKCLGKMKSLSHEQGRTVLFVSHQLGVISKLCNRAVLLKNGQLTFTGKCEEVVTQYLCELCETNEYQAFEQIELRSQIRRVRINPHGKQPNEIALSDAIHIEVEATVLRHDLSAFLGIGIDDKYGNRITTFVKPIQDFCTDTKTAHTLVVKLSIPGGAIAPNNYSVSVALFVPRSEVTDSITSICPFRIIDDGSELSMLEGIDYGSVLLPATWEAETFGK